MYASLSFIPVFRFHNVRSIFHLKIIIIKLTMIMRIITEISFRQAIYKKPEKALGDDATKLKFMCPLREIYGHLDNLAISSRLIKHCLG